MTGYIVSMTTLPSRLNTLRDVLSSLLSQAPPPDQILLYVSFPLVLDIRGIKVVQVPRDVGPLTKVYYTLTDPSVESSAMVLVTDDDSPRPPGWAARLLAGPEHGVTSFATIIMGGYGFAFRKHTLMGVPDLFNSMSGLVWKIDDDCMTLYCVLNKIRIHKIYRGPVESVCVPLGVGGPTLLGLSGADSRDRLRLSLSSYTKTHLGVYFDLTKAGREITWKAHPSTFGNIFPPHKSRRS